MLVFILGKKRSCRGEIAVSNPRMLMEVASDASELPLLHSSGSAERLTGLGKTLSHETKISLAAEHHSAESNNAEERGNCC
jgi:hypothetical protein